MDETPSPLVSICIPTYRRPELLQECLASCFIQDYRPLEILVGDNSPDDGTERLLTNLKAPDGIVLRYQRNIPATDYSGNVNGLFARASGAFLLLIHDDDLLMAGAARLLATALIEDPGAIASFGRQHIANGAGEILPALSERTNVDYGRPADGGGRIDRTLLSALRQQFPNNGFLIRAEVRDRVALRPTSEIGTASDFLYGIELAQAFPDRPFRYVPVHTCVYRIGADSLSASSQLEPILRTLKDLALSPEDEPLRRRQVERICAASVAQCLREGRKRDALRLILSKDYPARSRFRPALLAQLVLLLLPARASQAYYRVRYLAHSHAPT